MQFGVNTWVWVSPLSDAALRELAPKVAALGFDMIELPIEAPGDFDPAAAREVLRDCGLGASAAAAISPERDLIHPDENIRAQGVAYVRECIEIAHAAGATNLIGPLYSAVGRVWQSTPAERERDIELLVRQLRGLAEYAAAHDVVLCVEPLNRFETSLINLAAQGAELIDRVDHPHCRLMLDTFHMNIEERSLGDAIRLVGRERLRHVHACENDRGAPGSGHVPWNDVAAALHDIGYDGPVVIESFTSEVKSIARAAAVWRPFASSQDALASDGIAFLRGLMAC